MRIEAVIFDMDGTLIDSEPTYRVADERFLADRGVELPEEVWDSFVGVGSAAMIDYVKEHYGLQGEREELLREKDRYYREEAERETQAFASSRLLVETISRRGLPQGVATASGRALLDFSLEMSGLKEYFHTTVSAEEVPAGKPAPDVYFEVARRLGVDPGECLALEDSRSGIEAGVAAGMRVVALPSVDSLLRDPLLARAVLVVPGGAAAMEPTDVLAIIDEANG